MTTFEDWWATRTAYGTEDKTLARDAWNAGQQVVIAFEFSVARAERTNAAPQVPVSASLGTDTATVDTPAVAAPCSHAWPANVPMPASWYCKCGTKVYRSYEDAVDD